MKTINAATNPAYASQVQVPQAGVDEAKASQLETVAQRDLDNAEYLRQRLPSFNNRQFMLSCQIEVSAWDMAAVIVPAGHKLVLKRYAFDQSDYSYQADLRVYVNNGQFSTVAPGTQTWASPSLTHAPVTTVNQSLYQNSGSTDVLRYVYLRMTGLASPSGPGVAEFAIEPI